MYVCMYVCMYVFLTWGGGVPCERGRDACRKFCIKGLKDAVLKQTGKRDEGHPHAFHVGVRPPVFMCPLRGTNQIEVVVLKVRLTNEKAGYNPLYPEAEGQTRLS